MFEISYLNELRRLEMEEVLPLLPPGCRILDFGSGTGEQARFLAEHGFDVIAIDLASSNYAADRLFPIQDYDGRKIPLDDQSVDVIFSSNVLEHVENLREISDEFRRVLKPDGFAVHVLPTAVWRSWTFATALADSMKAAVALPARLVRPNGHGRSQVLARELRHVASGFIPRAHGTAPEGLSELWSFSRPAWRRKFARLGFRILVERPVGLFYTGTLLFGDRIPIEKRRSLSHVLGSVTRAYVVKPAGKLAS
jgi:SAM-dependent methyltransferase